MYQPAHVDGRTVIILKPFNGGYRVVESGRLSFDGDSLTLIREDTGRTFAASEVDAMKLVTASNRIPECSGFDFFVIAPS